MFRFVFLTSGRLALNEERLDKELNHVTIHIYRTKSDNMPTTGKKQISVHISFRSFSFFAARDSSDERLPPKLD